MDYINTLAIAFVLGIDAFSVAVAAGAWLEKTTPRQRFRLSFHFGFFQFMMPVLGWLAGASIEKYIAAVDHWAVFAILAAIGSKMIKDSRAGDENGINEDITRGIKLVVLSVATSLDALAVGFGIGLMRQKIIIPSIIIGIVAAAMTLTGMLIGERASSVLGKKAAFWGGIVLIGIGIRVVIEHLCQG